MTKQQKRGERYPCSALIDGRCKNGFPVSTGCSPWQATDGSWMGGKPYCMNEPCLRAHVS